METVVLTVRPGLSLLGEPQEELNHCNYQLTNRDGPPELDVLGRLGGLDERTRQSLLVS